MSADSRNKSQAFRRENGSESSDTPGQPLGTHTETAADVASALAPGDSKRPEAEGADAAITDATQLKADRTTTTDPFPGHEGRAGEHRQHGPGLRRDGKGGGRGPQELLRHARKALLAYGAAGTNAQLIADLDSVLGDVDDGAPAPTPRMTDAALKSLHEVAHVDPTAAARLAMEKNNLKAQGYDVSDLDVHVTERAPQSTAPVTVAVTGKPVPQPQQGHV